MKLESSTPISYPKFRKVGDAVTGNFISYQADVPSKFGPENVLTLQGDQGKLVIRATANLSRTLRANLPDLPGTRLTVTYVGDTPSKKGFPVKLFDVETVEVVAPANEPMQQPVRHDVEPEPVKKTEQAA